MKTLPKNGKYLIILLSVLFIILLTAPVLFQKKVSGIILGALNRNLETKIEVGSMRLSFIRNFPKASVIMKNVVVHSSTDFNAADFGNSGTDTLLFAKSVFVIIRPGDIFTGKYRIGTVTARTGFLRFLADHSGDVNYNVTSGNKDSDGGVIIDLQKITLSGMNADYWSLGSDFRISGLIKEGKLRSLIAGENIDFHADTRMDIDSFRVSGTTIDRTLDAHLELSLKSRSGDFFFEKSLLTVETHKLRFEGSISKNNIYDLNINGDNADLSRIKRILPGSLAGALTAYNPSGTMSIGCSIKGPLTKKLSPHVEMNFTVGKGKIAYRNSRKAIDDITFRGRLTNGSGNGLRTSSLVLSDMKFRLGSAGYLGSFSITNFEKPVTTFGLTGRIFPAELRDFLDLKNIQEAGGSVDVNLKVKTGWWPKDSITLNDLGYMEPEGSLVFENFKIGVSKNSLVSNVNGKVDVSSTFRPAGLSFDYRGQSFRLDGEFSRLPEWLAGWPVTMTAKADITTDILIPEALFGSSSPEKHAKKSIVRFPENLNLDIRFNIGSFSYKTFSSSDIKGNLLYKPGQLTFKAVNMNALDGTISGSGFIFQNNNRSFISRGDFALSGINIKSAFTSFNNFGQGFIVADNLSGLLSGKISVLLPIDSLFRPKTKAVTAEGTYVLLNGALVNFEPVKQLSSFIELSELENIHFQKLENDFFIRNNMFSMPTMDVNSSAADISVNGQHSFDNDFEYHVKVLLSQVLSRKKKPARRTVTEFGVVEDDGLGRTSILLKITGNGEDVKVGYDLKAVARGVKDNIRSEKQTMKSILNEEYGWYSDSPAAAGSKVQEKQNPVGQKPRFSITWEETDSIPAQPAENNNEKGLKSLFRKK
jgi:hypothetical protein